MLDSLFQSFRSTRSESDREALFAAIRNLALRRLGDDDEAQTVCFEVARGLANYRGEVPFTHWLSSVIRRHRADVTRRLVQERATQPLPEEEEGDGHSSPISPLPLERMDPITRRAADAVLTGYTLREAANLIGLSENALGMRLRRLGQKLSAQA